MILGTGVPITGKGERNEDTQRKRGHHQETVIDAGTGKVTEVVVGKRRHLLKEVMTPARIPDIMPLDKMPHGS